MSLGRKSALPKSTQRPKSNVYRFPSIGDHDPLQDEEILRMMQKYYSAGCVDMFGLRDLEEGARDPEGLSEKDMPSDFKSWLKTNKNAAETPIEELKEYGLGVPVALVRAPAKRGPAKFEALRFLHGIGGLKVQHMIIGSWFFGRKLTRETIARYCWMEANNGKGLEELLLQLLRGGHITISHEEVIKPTRAMLYRAIECVYYLVDVLEPLHEEFRQQSVAQKFQAWPDTDEGIPDNGAK